MSGLIERTEKRVTKLLPPGAPGSPRDSIHRLLLTGGLIVLLLAFGVGGWAATTQIAGALIAQGSVVVDSNVKKVQHPTGGVVGKLNVQDGDRVKAGAILVQLDSDRHQGPRRTRRAQSKARSRARWHRIRNFPVGPARSSFGAIGRCRIDQ